MGDRRCRHREWEGCRWDWGCQWRNAPDQVRGFPRYSCVRQARVHSASQETGGNAAVEGDREAQFVPGRRIHQGGSDAEFDAAIDKDGANRTVAVLGDDFREHFLLGRGLAVEGGILGRPARRDGPSAGARLATGRASSSSIRSAAPIRFSARSSSKGRRRREARVRPPLSLAWRAGEAEQTVDDEDGDQRGIGGAEDARGEGVPGDIIGVVFLAQCLDEVPAVGEQGAEETQDLAGSRGVRGARTRPDRDRGVWARLRRWGRRTWRALEHK